MARLLWLGRRATTTARRLFVFRSRDVGTYITDNDLYSRWGKDNIDEWASLDNQATPTAATRRADAIAWAEKIVEDAFRDGRYAVPFTFGTTDSARPVKEWMTTLAGVWLFQTHGWAHGEDDKLEQMNKARDAVYSDMNRYHAGMAALDATQNATDGPTAPHV